MGDGTCGDVAPVRLAIAIPQCGDEKAHGAAGIEDALWASGTDDLCRRCSCRNPASPMSPAQGTAPEWGVVVLRVTGKDIRVGSARLCGSVTMNVDRLWRGLTERGAHARSERTGGRPRVAAPPDQHGGATIPRQQVFSEPSMRQEVMLHNIRIETKIRSGQAHVAVIVNRAWPVNRLRTPITSNTTSGTMPTKRCTDLSNCVVCLMMRIRLSRAKGNPDRKQPKRDASRWR